ncbi:UDP-glucose dehydrogenase family protein [Amycolatopsis sp. NPDC057786]|uniref:UDP-glucose dehydrogenase family protein n=1 Tax=Amycolatopsis sp. NPDC057786 TaxID=3346250 RepID=UPI00366F8D5F
MHSYRIAVIGAGYVGLTAAACLAALGHRVACADVDPAKLEMLERGETTLLEPGLAERVTTGLAAGRLRFVLGAAAAVTDAEVVFLCVPTPMAADGEADLAIVESVVAEIRDLLPPGCVLVEKSTVPVGTAARISDLLDRENIGVVSNPEFLREGSAVEDFLNPDRIVVGSDKPAAAERVAALYAGLGAPTVITDAASAEMVKYAANCFLATKLSYVNALAELCERLGANIVDVAEGMGYDRRIGTSFLRPGPGWGGSCLPKDTHALLAAAGAAGVDFDLLKAVIGTNFRQAGRIADKVAVACGLAPDAGLDGVRIGLLGLVFKADTNDLRSSPALAVAEELAARGAELAGYDPGLLACDPGGSAERTRLDDLMFLTDDPYLTAKDAQAVVVLTEWREFRTIDWRRMAGLLTKPVVVDTRNHLDRDVVELAGLSWTGVGIGTA